MNAARLTFGLVAVLAGVLVCVRACRGGDERPASSSASQAASASSSASTGTHREAAEAAKVTTRTVDQAPTRSRDRSSTTFYRPNGSIDHVTIREREVLRGRRREAVEAAEASRSASEASSSSTSASSSSSSSSSFTGAASRPASWAILYGSELAPRPRAFGLGALELRLLGPVWATAWASRELEAGAGLRLDLGRLTIGFAPRVLPTPELGGLASATLQLVGPFQVAAWARATSSSTAAGAGLRVAW